MATERREPFRQALGELRRRLRDDTFASGDRIAAKEVADDLRLSPTPVREALSRLAGEGLLEERRGDGFFVPVLAPADIAALYHLSEQLLLFSQSAPQARPRDMLSLALPLNEDPVRAVERLFWAWVGESGSRVAIDTYRNIMARLAPIRRREAAFIPDLSQEAEALLRLADAPQDPRRLAAIRDFHARRFPLVEGLCRLFTSNNPDANPPI